MCGGTDLVKQDGVFVCQSCGSKYSIEDAKKLMVEGSVDVQGTVSIDNSQKLENLIQLARRARDENNFENAQKYYDMILLEDAENWEATFYHVYSQSMECRIGEIANAATAVGNATNSALMLLSKNTDMEYINSALKEITAALIKLSVALTNSSTNTYARFKEVSGSLNEYRDRITSIFLMLKLSADTIWNSSVFYNDNAIELYKMAMTIAEKTILSNYIQVRNFDSMESIIVERIRKYKPEYLSLSERKSEKESNGCYVATAVYGSYDCPQVWTLRRYRDDTLAGTWYGRAFIRIYYAISPTLVKWFGKTGWFKKMWQGTLDRLVDKLQSQGVEATPYEDKNWK